MRENQFLKVKNNLLELAKDFIEFKERKRKVTKQTKNTKQS